MSQLLRSELKSLERKLTLLLADYGKLKEDYQQAQQENLKLKKQLSESQEKISTFQNRLKISKIADSLELNGDNDADLKQVLSSYIEEIDKCIAHLSE